MQGIYYLLSMFGILILIAWYVQNERNAEDPSKGILGMDSPTAGPKAARKSKRSARPR
jgi:hypothetical protein